MYPNGTGIGVGGSERIFFFRLPPRAEGFIQLPLSTTRARWQRLKAMALSSLRLQLGLLDAVVRDPNRLNLELNSSRPRSRARACGPPAAHFCAARLVAASEFKRRHSHERHLPGAGVAVRGLLQDKLELL